MCVVLIGRQQEGPCRWKHARYLDVLEQLQGSLCENTHCTKCRNNQHSPRLQASMIMLHNGEKEALAMCVVLVGRQEEGHRTQRRTHQCSPRLHASMIMLPNGEKEELTMCVVLVGRQKVGPWRRKHARYLDGRSSHKVGGASTLIIPNVVPTNAPHVSRPQ